MHVLHQRTVRVIVSDCYRLCANAVLDRVSCFEYEIGC